MNGISVVIPTWNGVDLLVRCLPAMIVAIEKSKRPYEVIIVDDASSDQTVEMLEKGYPEIQLLVSESRKGFGDSVNMGIEAAEYKYILLLNNDVVLDQDFFVHILKQFDREDIFAVMGKTLNKDGTSLDNTKQHATFRRGLFSHRFGDDRLAAHTLFACAAAALYDRDKVTGLGGMDSLYKPAYMEDVDLSYRAWKRGWRTLYNPNAIAYHLGSVSMRQAYDDREILIMKQRNMWLFTWKNITDTTLVFSHIAWLPSHILYPLVKMNTVPLISLLRALTRYREVILKRKVERNEGVLSDSEVSRQCKIDLTDEKILAEKKI